MTIKYLVKVEQSLWERLTASFLKAYYKIVFLLDVSAEIPKEKQKNSVMDFGWMP